MAKSYGGHRNGSPDAADTLTPTRLAEIGGSIGMSQVQELRKIPSALPSLFPPSRVQNYFLEIAGVTSLRLTWTAPANNGGSAVLGYKIRVVDQATSTTVYESATYDTSPFTATGLTTAKSYQVRIAAVNSIGQGAEDYSDAIPGAAIPGAPTALSATAGDGQAALSWTAPASDGGAAITGYVVEYTPAGGSAQTTGTGSSSTSFTLDSGNSSITNGVAQSIKVAAVNSAGQGPYSSAVSVTPVATTVPGIPTGLSATAGDTQVSLTWTAPASNGGSAITNYSVRYTPSGGSPTTVLVGSATASRVVTALTNSTVYAVEVAAVNAIGTGSYTSSVSVTPVAAAPTSFAPRANAANFNSGADWDGQDGNVTTVGTNGGPSAYGTYDQTGNVYEWNDRNGTAVIRGGYYLSGSGGGSLQSYESVEYGAGNGIFLNGFRLASSFSTLNPLSLSNFVTVGDANNDSDGGGYGGVSYSYAIGKYVVTNTEYREFLAAVAATDTYDLYSTDMADARGGITRSGSSGTYTYAVKTNYGNKPVIFVNWFDCSRYCNWLHNGKPTGSQNNSTTEDGAYTLNGATTGSAVAKNAGAKYHIPTENEWYKAAYYKRGGTSAGYWIYATQSNALPDFVSADSAGNGPPPDPYFEQVALLLPMDGQGATIIDSSPTPKTITVLNATQSTAEIRWGRASGYFHGPNCYISFPDLGIGTGDFAIEMWLKTAVTGSDRPILANTDSGVGYSLFINYAGDGNVAFSFGGNAPIVLSSGVDYSDDQWHYIAVSRSGSTIRMYLDGAIAATGTSSGNFTSAVDTRVGSDAALNNPYADIVAYIDDLRITVGYARGYTGATITVPAAAFPNK